MIAVHWLNRKAAQRRIDELLALAETDPEEFLELMGEGPEVTGFVLQGRNARTDEPRGEAKPVVLSQGRFLAAVTGPADDEVAWYVERRAG